MLLILDALQASVTTNPDGTAYGVGWRSYTEQFLDSVGPFRDAVLAILATLAKQERIRIGERTRAGLDP